MARKNPAALNLGIFATALTGAFGLYRWQTRKAFARKMEEEGYGERVEETLPVYAPWFGFAPASMAYASFYANRPKEKFDEAGEEFERAGKHADVASQAAQTTAKLVAKLVAQGELKKAARVAADGGMTVKEALAAAGGRASSGFWALTPWGEPGVNGLPYGEAEYLGFSDPGSEHVIRHGWKRVE